MAQYDPMASILDWAIYAKLFVAMMQLKNLQGLDRREIGKRSSYFSPQSSRRKVPVDQRCDFCIKADEH